VDEATKHKENSLTVKMKKSCRQARFALGGQRRGRGLKQAYDLNGTTSTTKHRILVTFLAVSSIPLIRVFT
jgi:hypothetical protein